MPETSTSASPSPRSQEIFKSTSEETQKLIKEVLKDEREVQHMTRRAEIHTKIYDHVRRLIK